MKKYFLASILFLFSLNLFGQDIPLYSNGCSIKLSYEIPDLILNKVFKPTVGFDVLYTYRKRKYSYYEFGIGFRNFSPLSPEIHFAGSGTAESSHLVIFPLYFSRSGDIVLDKNLRLNIGIDLGYYYSRNETHVHYQSFSYGGTSVQGLIGVSPKIGLTYTDEKNFQLTLLANYNLYFPLLKEDPLFIISNSGYSPYGVVCLGIKGTYFFPSIW